MIISATIEITREVTVFFEVERSVEGATFESYRCEPLLPLTEEEAEAAFERALELEHDAQIERKVDEILEKQDL